jgi:hypothetical protein
MGAVVMNKLESSGLFVADNAEWRLVRLDICWVTIANKKQRHSLKKINDSCYFLVGELDDMLR